MSLFNYTATDSLGKKVTGSVDARSKDIAVNLIKQKGFYLISNSLQESLRVIKSRRLSIINI